MNSPEYNDKVKSLLDKQEVFLKTPNKVSEEWACGYIDRYENPVLTAAHTPVHWCYDLNEKTNPHLLQRLGMNVVLNSGAIEHEGKILLVARCEGYDRKSIFAVAESESGVDNFRFWDTPIVLDEIQGETNLYDMRLTKHEDGWVYGLFCSESKDPDAPKGDTSQAVAACGICRTKDFRNWERLPNLKTPSAQQRNVVLHPEFVDGKYFLYTRPMEFFVESGSQGGIGWGFCNDMTHPVMDKENHLDGRTYHTVYEGKMGCGGTPIKTEKGWLHIAHGVRYCAAGLRYVLYAFMADLDDPSKIIAKPGGYFLAPEGEERVGDVSNVLFSNGVVVKEDGSVFLYYASSDTRMHVGTSTVEKLVDYCFNTPADGLTTYACSKQRYDLATKNLEILKENGLA